MNFYFKDFRCVKCGEIGATSSFKDYDGTIFKNILKIKEIIIRTCANCGHTWYELPIDDPSASADRHRLGEMP